MAQLQQLQISINGIVNPSLIRMINQAQSQLQALGASVKTQNAAMNAIYKQAFSGAAAATTQANSLAAAMGRIGETTAALGINDLFIKGLETGVGLVEKMAEGMKSLSETASAAAAKFELLSKGMGALLRDQGFADLLLTQLQKIEYKSPFEHLALGGIARELTGRGMEKEKLLGATTELGDITAGLGGSQDILERLSLAYGEAFDQEFVDKRIMRQFTMAGVPMLDAMMNALGLNHKNAAEVQRFFKMVHDKQIPFSVLNKAMYNLTHDGGLFEDGMLHFADTFRGLITTFNAMFLRAEQDFGGIINDWLEVILRFVNTSGIWDEIHDWFVKLSDMSRSVITFATGLHESFPVFDRVFGMFDKLNAFIGSFFTEVDIQNSGTSGLMGVGGGSRHMVLNAMGDEKIKEIFDAATKIFNAISDFVTSPAVQKLAQWSGSVIVDQFKAFFNDLEMIINVIYDLSQGHWDKARTDFNNWKKFAMPGDYKGWAPPDTSPHGHPNDQEYLQKLQDNTDALQSLTDGWTGSSGTELGGNAWLHGGPSWLPRTGGNAGLHGGLSDAAGAVYEQYPWEGHAANYGPRNNKLQDDGTEVGIGEALAQEKGIKLGDWAKVTFADGTTMVRQRKETSERLHGIEFFSNERNKYTKHGKATVEKVEKPTTEVHIHYAPVVSALDSGGIHEVLNRHIDDIAEAVNRHTASYYERTAPV